MQGGWMIAAAGMIVLAITDMRRKEIPLIYLVVFGMAAVIYTIVRGNIEWNLFFSSLLPGIFLLGISLCTREGIGYGDGWAVMILGLLIGTEDCFITVCMGLLLIALISVILLIMHKVNGKSRIPFLPFLTIGLGVELIVQSGIY